MQHVKISWLKRINYVLTTLSGFVIVGFLYFQIVSPESSAKAYWGITAPGFIFAALLVAYGLLIYPRAVKRNGWLAGSIGIAMFGLLLVLLIETSQQGNYVYRVILSLTVFLSAAIGALMPLVALSLIWLLFIFTLTAIVPESKTPLSIYILINCIHTAAGYFGWVIFSKHYVATGKESQLENRLETEQVKSTAILESITDGVLVVDTKNIIQLSNTSAAQMLGWTKEEVTGLDYHSLLKPLPEEGSDPSDRALEEAVTKALAGGTVAQQIDQFETVHGRQLYIDIVASPIYQSVTNSEGSPEKKMTGVIAVLRNVDQQKREEQQRSDFISTASHEMRTPVASIQGYLELALNPKISNLDEKTKSYLDKAYTAAKHLGQLFQDLLTVSRSEDGRLANHPRVVNIPRFLGELVDQQVKRAQDKGLSLTFEGSELAKAGEKSVQPLLFVKADPERLREVLQNLIENAIKYTSSGSIKVRAQLQNDAVVISVSDTGPGIAEEDIPHLFQKFYRVDNSATREIGGTGLGLYITKQIIEVLGGRVWVKSKLGEGSTFFIELPRTQEASIPPSTSV